MIELKDQLISVPEAAKLVNVNPSTIRRWIYAGKILAWRRPHGRHWLVRALSVEEFVAQR